MKTLYCVDFETGNDMVAERIFFKTFEEAVDYYNRAIANGEYMPEEISVMIIE